jgi:hypothetical protein
MPSTPGPNRCVSTPNSWSRRFSRRSPWMSISPSVSSTWRFLFSERMSSCVPEAEIQEREATCCPERKQRSASDCTARRVPTGTTRCQRVSISPRPLHLATSTQRVPSGVNPGELVNQWLEIAPGSNRIVSLLDIVAPDETAISDISQRLASLRYYVQVDGNQNEAYWDPYWVRFRSAVTTSFLQTELGALSGHILSALTGHRDR